MCKILWTQINEQIYAKFYNYLTYVDPMQIVICFIIVMFFISCIEKKYERTKIKTVIWCVLCSVWFTVAFEITLLGRQNNVVNTWESVFSSFSELVSGNYTIIYDMIFNGILFIPLGFLMKIKYSAKYSVAISGGVSLFIEGMQLITHKGLFEISDLIFNTSGGVIGIACMAFIQKFLKIFSQKYKICRNS